MNDLVAGLFFGCMFLLLTFLLFCVSTGAMDHSRCLESVRTKYPNERIAVSSSSNFRFIVVCKSGEIREVDTMYATSTEISKDNQIIFMEPKNKESAK